MLSSRLIQLIETNWQEIARRLTHSIQRHADMPVLAGYSETDLREWCQEILENLSYLLAATTEEEVGRRFQVLGKLRFEENVPLHEAVLRFHLLRQKVVGFVREQAYPVTGLELYAQEELVERMAAFFDACVYHVVRGYEAEMRRALRRAS